MLEQTGRALEGGRSFEDLTEKMELQERLKSYWSRYFCNQPLVEMDASASHPLFCSELRGSSVRPEGSSDPCIWTDAEPARFKSCSTQSFAMDARIRLDSLKSGCSSPLPWRAVNETLYNYERQKELWDSESEEEESALDLVELLDVEDDEQDEESWLYEFPKKPVVVEKTESALRWCRHVLDNPSPEVEAARRLLINKLDQRSSSHFYGRPAVFHHRGSSAVDTSSDSRAQDTSDSLVNNGLSICHESVNTNYRLEDITDVHIMARIQEDSLRRDYVSVAASPRRSPESPLMLPSHLNTTAEGAEEVTPGNLTGAPSPSSRWRPALPSLSSSSRRSPAPVARQSCQSPKLARLHQQVTQYKLLKLAQNGAASPGRTGSPVRTSLRSLQAVRSSRSLESDAHHPADQIVHPPSGASSAGMGSRCWSPSFSAASATSHVSSRGGRDRMTAVKGPQRSQSLSPRRIPHSAKAYLSVHGRVFASPERSSTAAWARNAASTRR